MKTLIILISLFSQDSYSYQNKIESEDQFLEVIQSIEDIAQAWVKPHGAQLKINPFWSENKPNANAGQRSKHQSIQWQINVNGGLARNKYISKDAFILTLCHELGHHLGGYPFFSDTVIAGMSVEGQADYFSSFCLKEIWKNDHHHNLVSSLYVNTGDKYKCEQYYQENNKANLCYRVMNAIRSKEDLYKYHYKDKVILNEKDVKKTKELHPSYNCRIKTMMASNLCNIDWNYNIIPGKKHYLNPKKTKLESSQYSCNLNSHNKELARPSCWFFNDNKINYGVSDLKLINFAQLPSVSPGDELQLDIKAKYYPQKPTIQKTPTYISLATSTFYNITDNSKVGIPIKNREAKNSFFNIGRIKINNQTYCGKVLPIIFNIQDSSNIEKQIFKIETGEKVISGMIFTNNINKKIPDLNSYGYYLNSSISVKEETHLYDKAILTFDIKHMNSADLIAYLFTPQGQKIKVFDKRGYIAKNKNSKFLIDLNKPLAVNGRWKLEIKDLIPRNHGQLNAWSLRFIRSICSK